MCVGLARHCLERSVTYAHERESFGKPIAEHGAVGGMLANMAMDVEAMQALSLELLARLDQGTLLIATRTFLPTCARLLFTTIIVPSAR